MKWLPFLLFMAVFYTTSVSAQDSVSHEMSAPVDIPQLGWDKVLLMSNGNTLLIHLQQRKGIVVKTFDKERKEISSLKHICDVIDINALERSWLKGVYEIGGEAVMFISQYIENRETLVRLRFSADDGKLIKEEKLIQSPTFQNRTSCYVVYNKNVEGYSIFCFKNLEVTPKEELKLIKYSSAHKVIKEIPIPNLGMDSMHYAKMVTANVDNNGSFTVALQLSKIKYYPDILDKYLVSCYLPADADKFVIARTSLGAAMEAYYTHYSFNPVEQRLNLMVTTEQMAVLKDGLRPVTQAWYIPYMLVFNETDLNDMVTKPVIYRRGSNYRQQLMGREMPFRPAPVKMFTNENGITTLISQEHVNNAYWKGIQSSYTYLGHIGITQLDESGEEIWGVVLPKAHYVEYNVYPAEYVMRGMAKPIFAGQHDKAYEKQFSSIDCYTANKNLYLIYNDAKGNTFKTIKDNIDTVYSYKFTEAVLQRMGRKKEMLKTSLFGEQKENESRSVMLESADFDDKTLTYAALIRYRKDDKYEMHVAWCHLK
ncbi:MAG: hypothetical protein EOP56_17190 [Sphingobacteriales bacterium]|nr:MAG: hypothetical protein EOP56_17190 [Sphingobacteriales bacterium]